MVPLLTIPVRIMMVKPGKLTRPRMCKLRTGDPLPTLGSNLNYRAAGVAGELKTSLLYGVLRWPIQNVSMRRSYLQFFLIETAQTKIHSTRLFELRRLGADKR